jgi:hypothetical protein
MLCKKKKEKKAYNFFLRTNRNAINMIADIMVKNMCFLLRSRMFESNVG